MNFYSFLLLLVPISQFLKDTCQFLVTGFMFNSLRFKLKKNLTNVICALFFFSMGGHGALIAFLKNPQLFKVSHFYWKTLRHIVMTI